VQQVLDDRGVRERLVGYIEDSGVNGLFSMQIGRDGFKLLRGEIDALTFMFYAGLADTYHEKMLANDHHAYLASQYIDLLSSSDPSMNTLEVGAGTSGQTTRVLYAMSSGNVEMWTRYGCADISPVFFNQARRNFLNHVDQMYFKVAISPKILTRTI